MSFQFLFSGGWSVLTCDKITHFLGSTVFRFLVTITSGVLAPVDGASIAWLTPERGLDVVLGWPLGLKLAANGLGRNSWLLGFNFPPMWAGTPMRRPKEGSVLLAGPVGGSRISWPGGIACCIFCCSMFRIRADS